MNFSLHDFGALLLLFSKLYFSCYITIFFMLVIEARVVEIRSYRFIKIFTAESKKINSFYSFMEISIQKSSIYSSLTVFHSLQNRSKPKEKRGFRRKLFAPSNRYSAPAATRIVSQSLTASDQRLVQQQKANMPMKRAVGNRR